MVALALAAIFLSDAQAPAALPAGKDFYLPGPAVRLGRYITSEKFSRDGQFITFIDERPEGNYVSERTLIGRGEETSARAVVRFDLKKGIRQTLFIQVPGETLTSIEPVGPGGDIICTVSVGIPQGDEYRWKAVYCPVGGSPKDIASEQSSRSFQVASSATERKAFILSCGLSGPTRLLFLTPDSTTEKSLDITAFQGGFFQNTKSGNPIACLQGPGPDYALLGNFECNFATGEAFPVKTFEQSDGIVETPPLISFKSSERSKGNPSLGQAPLCDIFASAGSTKDRKNKLIVAQGVITSVSEARNGLAITYLTAEGYFLKEMVKADPTYRKKLGSF